MRALVVGLVCLIAGLIAGPRALPILPITPGIVLGAGDLTNDKGETRTYRLYVGDRLGKWYTIAVSKADYEYYTRPLGGDWP